MINIIVQNLLLFNLATRLMSTMNSKDHAPLNSDYLDVLLQFRIIYSTMRQHFRMVESQCGVSSSQMWLLQEIKTHPGILINALSKKLLIQQPTASLLVDKLLKKQMVKKVRQAQDQRRVGLWITPLGESLLEKIPSAVQGVLPQALQQLPDVVLKTLMINLSELIKELEKLDDVTHFAAIPLANMD